MGNHVSIFGVCVLRDIFRVCDKNKEYIIDKYIQQVNPVSAVGISPLVRNWDDACGNCYDIYMSEGIRNFHKKCIQLDMKKEVFDYFRESVSDWFILDMGELRKRLALYRGGGIVSYIYSKGVDALQDKQYIEAPLSVIDNVLHMDAMKAEKAIEKFLESVQEIYSPERIIIMRCECACFCVNGGSISAFNKQTIDEWNRCIDFGFEICKKYLPEAHYIEFPEYIIADSNHIWGRDPLHYVDELYDYGWNALKIIFQRKSLEEERGELLILKERYTRILKKKYEWCFVSSLPLISQNTDLMLRYKTNYEFLKKIVISNNKNLLCEIIKKEGFEEIAIYGLLELSKVMIEILLNAELEIAYIVENNYTTYKGIDVIKRDWIELPEVDCIIITDIFLKKRIIQKLNTWNPEIRYLCIDDVYKK